MAHLPDEDPGWLHDYKVIDVEINSLDDFAKALRQELEVNFRPHAQRILNELASGPQFGDHVNCYEVGLARGDYVKCLERISQLLVSYDNGTNALVTGAEAVARRYAGSDAYSAATTKDVTEVLPPQDRQESAPMSSGGYRGRAVL